MDIIFFKKVIRNLIISADRTNIADPGPCRFFHHISKLTCEHDLAFSRHHIHFDLESVPTHTGPCKSTHNPDLIRCICHLIRKLLFSQIFEQILLCNCNTLFPGCKYFFCCFSANITDFSLQLTYSRFFCIVGCNLPDCIFAYFQLFFLQTIFLQLFWDQMLCRNVQLLILCVAGHLDHFHTVQKRTRNRLQ